MFNGLNFLSVTSAVWFLVFLPVTSLGQVIDTLLVPSQPIASFEDAVSLSIDPAGLIYVVDAGSQSVVRLDQEGRVVDSLGGGGSGQYQLFQPADVDPTNGLEIYVADSGNSRVGACGRHRRFCGPPEPPLP